MSPDDREGQGPKPSPDPGRPSRPGQNPDAQETSAPARGPAPARPTQPEGGPAPAGRAAPEAARESAEEEDPGRLKRRQVLRVGLWGSLGLFTAQLGGVFLASFFPRDIIGFGGLITAGRVEDFPRGSVTKVSEGKLYISHVPEGLLALYWVCPHLGCTVPWREESRLFICPCHASTYEPNGQLIAGPAPRPMDIMPIRIEGGRVIVDTGDIRQRERWDPEQATPVPATGHHPSEEAPA